MKKRLLAIPTSLLLTGAVWPVVTMAEEDTAKNLDRNQDGYISVAEADADVYLAENFTKLDANGDGLLDRQELAARHQKDESNDN